MLHRPFSKRDKDRDPGYHKRITDEFIFTSENYFDDDNYLVLPKSIFEKSPGETDGGLSCYDVIEMENYTYDEIREKMENLIVFSYQIILEKIQHLYEEDLFVLMQNNFW